MIAYLQLLLVLLLPFDGLLLVLLLLLLGQRAVFGGETPVDLRGVQVGVFGGELFLLFLDEDPDGVEGFLRPGVGAAGGTAAA